MNEYFSTPENQQKLQNVLEAWAGTPFVPFASVKGKGGGVDCARFALAVMVETEACPAREVTERYAIHSDGMANLAIILRMMKNLGLRELLTVDEIRAGDALVFSDEKERNHLGVASSSANFVHCVMRQGVVEGALQELTFNRALKHAFVAVTGEV